MGEGDWAQCGRCQYGLDAASEDRLLGGNHEKYRAGPAEDKGAVARKRDGVDSPRDAVVGHDQFVIVVVGAERRQRREAGAHSAAGPVWRGWTVGLLWFELVAQALGAGQEGGEVHVEGVQFLSFLT